MPIREKIMLLNGKRLIIHGVNLHEWNPRRGPTSHYPNQSLWYQLLDENGILEPGIYQSLTAPSKARLASLLPRSLAG
ncbi:glycoside hydrolase family 2 TIM barrel-domain containing protein [Enterocloster sp.]|uniref:glycoside hydrolase family 2 TIM barrel-domain containing protein n=1 Tax=Enterocloster sp. TaxID=2719315 RepID=UPI00174947AB